MTTATTVTIPDSVNLLDLTRRVIAAFQEEWHFTVDADAAAYHVESALGAGQADADYQHGEYVKKIWLIAGEAGLKAGVGKAPDRLRAEILVVWSETEPSPDEEVTYTTAPKDYDWFGTRTLGVVGNDKRGKEIRRVAGPKHRVENQRGRYGSGNHLAVDEAEWKKLVDYKLVEVV